MNRYTLQTNGRVLDNVKPRATSMDSVSFEAGI